MREQGALACPRLARHASAPGGDFLGRRFGQGGQFLGDLNAADETAAPVLDELLQRPALLVLPTRQWLPDELPGLLVQIPPQVFQDLPAPLFKARDTLLLGVPLRPVLVHAARQAGIAPDAVLQRLQPLGGICAGSRVVRVAVQGRRLRRHLIVGQRIAEVE